MVDVPVLGKMILNILHLSWTMLKFAALRPLQSPLFVLKFDLLLGNLHKSDNPERPGVFAHLWDRHTHNNEWQI